MCFGLRVVGKMGAHYPDGYDQSVMLFTVYGVYWVFMYFILRLFDRDNAQYIIEPDCSHKANLHL